MQTRFSPGKLAVILLSTDESKLSYQKQAPGIFAEYGGGNWPSVVLPNGFNSALRFGDFGYGKLIVDEEGIVRSIGDHDLEQALETLFSPSDSSGKTDNGVSR